MNLLIMGPPGVGKGTQAKIICKKLNIIHISTGEILRNEIRQNTKIGLIAKSFINIGKLAPDDIILDIIDDNIKNENYIRGYLLDGFPRTIAQAQGFDKILKKREETLTMVINLTANTNELINRIIKRGKDFGRSDDILEIIKERQKIYLDQTAPLIEYYNKKNILKNINGIGKINEITNRILKILN